MKIRQPYKSVATFLLLSISSLYLWVGVAFAWPWPNPALSGNVGIDVLNGTVPKDNFEWLINEVVDPIRDRIETNVPFAGDDGIVIFVIDLFKSYVFPLLIIIAVLMGIFGFMEMMTQESEDKKKKGIDYFIWWVVGIIIFTWAEFIFNGLYGIINDISANSDPLTAQSRNVYAGKIFDQIAYPFLKLAMYLIMWWLFIQLLVKSLEYVVNPSEKAGEQGRNIIVSAAMGILVIILSKTLVEAVYSKQELILADTTTIFVWWWVLDSASQNYQTIFTVINYVLWFLVFAVLCLILYQGYLMLFNSNNEEWLKKMRKNLLYIFGWLLLIWLSYIIVNFFIIN